MRVRIQIRCDSYRGWRLIWAGVPPKNRAVIKALAIGWANAAWVTALSTWNRIEDSRRSELGFCGGILFSSTVLWILAIRVYRKFKERLDDREI